jgi:regulator of sigma E protease
MITGAIPPDVAGPIGIVAVVGEVMQTGIGNLFSLAAIISINLGIINLLPIPALDGSKLLFLALEGIRGKPIDPQKEGFIHFVGFAMLIALMIFISFHDIIRLL